MGLKHHPRVVTDGLVYYLDAANPRCYSGSGLTANALIGGIGGTLVNGVGFGNTNNGSFTFDGTNDYIVIPTSSAFDLGTGSATIIAWFKTTTTFEKCIVSKRNNTGFQLYVLSSKLYADGASISAQSVQNVNTGNNVFGAAVYDRTNSLLRMYVNGKEDGNSFLGATSLTDTADINVGRATLFFTRDYFDGNIYQVSIYNRALSAQEVLQNYNATKKRYV